MKNQTKLLISLLLVSSSLHAFMRLGEGNIDLTLDVSTYYDSEIRGQDEGLDDLIFTASPGLQYSRQSRNFGIDASAGVTFVKYADNDQFDDENFFFDLSFTPGARMETSRFVISGDLILSNETRTEESVGNIVTVLTYGASGSVTYNPNSKYSLIGGVSYSREDPDSDLFSEKDQYGASLTLEVPVSETTNSRIGVSYGKTESDTSVTDNDTFTYFVGLSGNLLPKVSGSIDVGIQQQKLDSGKDEKSPYLSAGLQWSASERTQVALDASKSFGTTIDDRTSESLSFSVTGSHQLTRAWSVNVFAGYIEDDYSGPGPLDNRTDEETFVGAGTSYQLVEWGSIGLDIRYSDQSSSESTFEYDRLRVGINFSGQW
ncbi:outer membrane beta-barrel protein [Puniceicoccales bacterium CK1056]|uniref:Outer membrane beta-barrel protein n=1 Tax=Oceanipulchritudo coccoides TaxID=2706888 RepID=A0A6B2M1W6_9BACT|nr:outer membrane beta-barrel protein [Oceanipulchritudo coccoides]NDV62332.1 outer membrane beta-barrel protein [Oceanipulchritudo coccoides]